MSISFHCPCGFHGTNFEEIEAHTKPLNGSCCNCGGQRCMDCVFRAMHDKCEDDCPDCCAVAAGGPTDEPGDTTP